MFRRLISAALWWALAGFAIPVLLLAVDYLGRRLDLWTPSTHNVFTSAMLVLWPTSLTMMATEGATTASKVYLFLIAAGSNGVLYGVVGSILQSLVGAVYHRVHS